MGSNLEHRIFAKGGGQGGEQPRKPGSFTCARATGELKPGFDIVVTVVKLESRSFSSAEIQHHRTENTRSDYN